MTKDELDAVGHQFIIAVNQFRRDNPNEQTAIIAIGLEHGGHPDDRGWWLLACNKVSEVPFKPGSKEWFDAGNHPPSNGNG